MAEHGLAWLLDSFFSQLQVLLQRFWFEPFWFALLLMLLLLLAGLVVLPGLLDSLRASKRFGIFRRIARDSLHDVIVPDGVGGNVYIAHLLLLPDRIAIFNEKPFAGKIFGDANVDQWTQTVRHGSYRFSNPLVELQYQIMAINNLTGQHCTNGYLVFSDDSEFPWGKPDNVYVRQELGEVFASETGPVQDSIQQAWSRLQQLGISSKLRRPRYGRYMLAALLILAAAGWLVWAWYGSAPALGQWLSVAMA